MIFSNIFKCCFSLEEIVCCLRENVFYVYFPNVLLDLAAALAAMVLVGGLKQGSCRCDRTHQYPSCSAVNIYQAFSTNR